MQNQGGTEFANLHREFKRATESSRDSAQKMAQMQVTAKKMESEYRALLEAAVHKDGPQQWLPNMTSVIYDQFNLLKTELLEEKTNNQELIDKQNRDVADCNARMATRTTNNVDPLKTATGTSRDTHRACREIERGQVPDRDIQCVSPTYDDKPICEADQDYYNNGAKEAVSEQSFSADPALPAAIVQAGLCVLYREKGKQCDRDQVQFQANFCLYAQELRATCQEHDTCYDRTMRERSDTITDISALEASQKQVWKALGKIFCYMDHLKALADSNKDPTQADLQGCIDKDIPTNELDITKPDAAPKDTCDLTPVQFNPGMSQWQTNEYGALPFTDANLHQTTFPLGVWQRGMEAILSC